MEKQRFPLAQKRIVATGKMKNYTRAALMSMLSEFGATPMFKVSRNTDLLIVGSKPGGKLSKALALGVNILAEEEFEAMLSRWHNL